MCGFFANDYERLVRCFEADWEFAAATYFRTFLDHAPISFSHCQSITRKDMIGVGLWCFATAPKEHGYPLVELLANESLREDVEIPSHCIANVMHFIFNSGIPRSTRERLLLRIVDVDYKDEIMLEDYVCACVGAGFVSALKRTYNGRVEYESFVTAILLSDTPDDAFAFLESVTNESHDEARDAIVTRFRALLFLNAKRFIRLLLKSFPELHPSCIQNIRDTKVVIHYYDALFEEQKFGDDADSRFYVRYLADQSVEDLVKLLRRKELSADWIYELCESKGLALCCATMDAIKKDWEAAFRHYEGLMPNEGTFDRQLSIEIIEHLSELSASPLKVVRTLPRPLVHSPHVTPDLL